MKLPLFVLTVFFALLAPPAIHAQVDNEMRSNVKVITPFGWALLGGTALGTGVGCVYGAFDAAFIRVRIPIHKDLFLFQNARRKLSSYMY